MKLSKRMLAHALILVGLVLFLAASAVNILENRRNSALINELRAVEYQPGDREMGTLSREDSLERSLIAEQQAKQLYAMRWNDQEYTLIVFTSVILGLSFCLSWIGILIYWDTHRSNTRASVGLSREQTAPSIAS